MVNKCCALMVLLSLPMSAADLVFAGSLERVRHASISIRMADLQAIDAVLPPGTAVPYNLADQVEMTCAAIKTTYDAQAGIHYYLQLKSLRFQREATPQERNQTIALLSWQRGENLLKVPNAAVRSGEGPGLERIRHVNLEYVSKAPGFVADETTRHYMSDSPGKPWRQSDTIEDEIGLRDLEVTRQNVRWNGKPSGKNLHKSGEMNWGVFGVELKALFEPSCPNDITFAGREQVSRSQLLVYLFSSPANGCFGYVGYRQSRYAPARSGRVLVDAVAGNVIRYETEATGFPEKYGLDWATFVESWDYATIGTSHYLVPVSAEFVVRASGGQTERVTTEYKNHRHFEASAIVRFGNDK